MKQSKGVTLIELVVVLSIFILVFGAAATILVSIISHQKLILTQSQVFNEISYMEEFMLDDLRMAKPAESQTDIDCMEGHRGMAYMLTRYDTEQKVFKGIKFINQADENVCQEFFLDERDPGKPVVRVAKNGVSDNQSPSLNSTSVKIVSLQFALNGSDGALNQLLDCQNDIFSCGVTSSAIQPRVTMLLGFTFQGDPQKIRFLQSTVSKMGVSQ